MGMLKNPPDSLPADFYAVKTLIIEYKCCKSALFNHIRADLLPAPTRHHAHYVGWSFEVIEPYLAKYGKRDKVAK